MRDGVITSKAESALEYARRGWHVFPVPPGQKKGYKSAEHSGGRNWGATADPDEIRRDWTRWPEANVGIVTGAASGFFVIEADTAAGHGVDGIGNLTELIEANGPLPATIEALSPSGSWHVLFRWPEGREVRNSAGLIAPGVDVRGEGGMVVAAPSVKPGAALPYRWKNPPPLFDLAPCPDWLLDLATKPKAPPAGPQIDTGARFTRDITGRDEVDEILSWINPDCRYDDWLAVLMGLHDHFAGSAAGLAIADEWSARGAKYRGGEVASKWPSFTLGGRAGWGGVCALARQAGADLSEIARRHGGWPAGDLASDFAPDPAPEGDAPPGSPPHHTQAKPARLFPLTRFSDLPSAPPEWIVDGRIEAGALAMLFGPPGCGKSFVALDMAASVASGRAWHGRAVKAGPVIYLAGEGLSGLRRRLDAWRAHHDVTDDPPLFVGRRAPMLLDMADAAAVAEAVDNVAITEGPPRLVVIDTVARAFAGGDENATADMGRFVAAADGLKARYPECAILLVHHSGHAAQGRARGSSALNGAVDIEYGASKAGDVVTLRCTKMKDGDAPAAMAFALETVELGEARSAVLVPREGGAAPKSVLSSSMRRAMEAFLIAKRRAGHADDLTVGVTLEDWRKVAYEQSTADTQEARQKGFARARTALVESGHLSVADDVYRLARIPA